MTDQQQHAEPEESVEPLEDPGPPLVLTLKIDSTGATLTRYVLDPEDAIVRLRAIADQIEHDVQQAGHDDG